MLRPRFTAPGLGQTPPPSPARADIFAAVGTPKIYWKEFLGLTLAGVGLVFGVPWVFGKVTGTQEERAEKRQYAPTMVLPAHR